MTAVARLVVTAGDDGLLFLRPGRYVIGRRLDCDLILVNRGVSRHHAAVEVGDATATIVDQGSRHGTRVGGTAVERCPLEHGSVVQFGPVACRFEWLTAAAADHPTPSAGCGPADPDLTPAERRVLGHLLAGLSEKEIAARLTNSPHTVHNHVRKIYAAHAVNSRAELLAHFVRRPGGA